MTIAVIFGGRSQEHEASVASCAQIIGVLKKQKKYAVVPIGITKTGEWYTGAGTVEAFQKGTIKGLHRAVLAPDTSRAVYVMQNGKVTKRIHIDVAFAWVLGPYGEDGTMQGLLEMADIPYVGSPVFASACGFNKLTTKVFIESLGIPQVPYASITRDEWKKGSSDIAGQVARKIGMPCFVKPVSCGSSIGVSKVKKASALGKAINEALVFDHTAVVEAAVTNALEIECAVIGNDEPTASVPGQVEYDGEFYDYHAKYVSPKWNVHIPPKLSPKKVEDVRALAIRVFRALGAAGGARVDFLVDGKTKKIYFNEINTLPSFRSISMFTRLLEHMGMSYGVIIETLITLAIQRHAATSKRTLEYEVTKSKHDSATS